MVAMATKMVRKNFYLSKEYNLDIRLSFCDALKRISELCCFHKIWNINLGWYISALGVEYLKNYDNLPCLRLVKIGSVL